MVGLFPKLPHQYREVRFSCLRAGGLKLAALKTIEAAIDLAIRICGRCPTRMFVMLERIEEEYEEEGRRRKETNVKPEGRCP